MNNKSDDVAMTMMWMIRIKMMISRIKMMMMTMMIMIRIEMLKMK